MSLSRLKSSSSFSEQPDIKSKPFTLVYNGLGDLQLPT